MSRRMARTGGPGQQEVAHSRTDLSAGPRPQWVLANRSEWQIALSGLINHQPLISVFNTRRRPRLCHSPMLSPLSRPPAWCGQEVAPRAPPCHPLPVSGLFSATHGSSRPSARGGPWLRACSPVGLECLAWGSDSGWSQSWGIPMAYADRWPGAEALRRHRLWSRRQACTWPALWLWEAPRCHHIGPMSSCAFVGTTLQQRCPMRGEAGSPSP